MFEELKFLIEEVRKKLDEYEKEKEEVRSRYKKMIKEAMNEWAVETAGIQREDIELFNYSKTIYFIRFGERNIFWKDDENMNSGIVDLETTELVVLRYIYITIKSDEFKDRVKIKLENILKEITMGLNITRKI